MYKSLLINGAHLAFALAGFFSIARIGRSSRSNRYLWPLTFVLSALMASFLFFVSDPGSIFEDFRKAYWAAGHHILQGPQALKGIYSPDESYFVNAPIVAYVLAPLGWLEPKLSALAFSILGGFTLIWAWGVMVELAGLDNLQRAISVFALAAFGPLIHLLRQANTTHVVLAALLWGLLKLKNNKPYLAGATFGAMALIKPPLALLGGYFVLRRNWKVAAAAGGTLATLSGLSVLIFGLDLNLEWYRSCIEPATQNVLAAFNAQSINAMIGRLELGRAVLWDWSVHPVSTQTHIIVDLISAGLMAAAIWACVGDRRQTVEVEVALVLVLTCLISTLTWSHYYVWMLPAFAFLLVRTAPGGDAPDLRPWLIFAYVLTAPVQFLSEPMRNGVYPFAALISSHMVIGGLAVFGLLVVLQVRNLGAASDGSMTEEVLGREKPAPVPVWRRALGRALWRGPYQK